jgi:hypothetical protein
MDTAQAVIFYAEWIFFTAWGMVLAAVGVIVFGRDLRAPAQRTTTEKERR